MIEQYLLDDAGKPSSKRLCGIALITVGLIMSIVMFSYSLMHDVIDDIAALSVIEYLFVTGGALLGISVFENFKIGKKE